jgi:opacity protein-like surface antigen
VDAGAGVTATSIGPPDLSGTFEFNLQGGPGIQYFVMDNLSVGLESRYVHWSCAGIHKPNLGINGLSSLLTVSYYF